MENKKRLNHLGHPDVTMCQMGFGAEIVHRIYGYRVVLGIIGDLFLCPVLIAGDTDIVYTKKMFFLI
jgi:hypothetical protein